MKILHVRTDIRKKNLPFYVTEDSLYIGKNVMHIPEDLPHYKSRKAMKVAPMATREVKRVVQEYPRVIREIKRIGPKQIIYTTYINPESDLRATSGEGYIGVRRAPFPTRKWIPLFARTLAHELKHVEQERRHMIPEDFEFEEDYFTYRNLPWEKEANRYAKRIVPYHKGWSL
jgi:hypothetical protein